MSKPPTTLAQLKPDPANRRVHDSRNLDAIASSLREVGAARSIVIDEDDVILAGNGVTQAALAAGIENVRVIEASGEELIAVRRRGLTEEQKTRLALHDNFAGTLAEWDLDQLARDLETQPDLLAGLWDQSELDALLAEVTNGRGLNPDVDPDEIPEQVETRCKPGELWLMGDNHRLLCGDSTKREDVERLMSGERADCVFTSPPYAVGVDYGDYEDTIENLRGMLPSLGELWLEVVKDGGFAVINFGDIAPARDIAEVSEPCEYPMALEYWPAFRAAGWVLWSRRIWCKPNPRVHSPWCIQSNRAATDWEHLWTWKKPGRPILQRIDGDFASANGWYQSSHLHGVDVGKEIHGAGMAVGIAEWMLTTHSRKGAAVLEPFCGTGTTLIAAESLGRKCCGMELNPSTCDIALARWEACTSRQARRAE